jgi:hypothetical protein
MSILITMAFITIMPPPPMSYKRDYIANLRRYEYEDSGEPLTDKKAVKKSEGVWASFKRFWKVNHRIRLNSIISKS